MFSVQTQTYLNRTQSIQNMWIMSFARCNSATHAALAFLDKSNDGTSFNFIDLIHQIQCR